VLDADGLRDVMRRACGEAGIPVTDVGDDVDLVVRSGDGRAVTIVINHRDAELRLADLPLEGVDLVTGESASGPAVVPAGGIIAVLTERSHS